MSLDLKRKRSRSATEDAQHTATTRRADKVLVQSNDAGMASLPMAEQPQSPKNQFHARMERFQAAKQIASDGREQNRKAVAAEAKRSSINPEMLSSLQRKQDIAAQKLLKAETAASGEDFERKRAWDWTIEDSEKWDKRMEKKEKHRQDVAFQDYTQQARKIYKRQTKGLKADMDAYEQEKAAAVQRAVNSGRLEVVETEDGELVAVDKDGTFYSTADNADFVSHKPDAAAVNRLVEELEKAEAARLKNRKTRLADDDGDVTYINEKNKQFNKKLKRFYDKYTTGIRESFERGTAL